MTASLFSWLLLGVALHGLASSFVMPMAAWLAPVCLLHFTRHAPFVSGSVMMIALLYVVGLVSMRGVLPVDGPGFFLITLFIALRTMLPFLADRWLSPRLHGVGFAATPIFPAAYVAMEFVGARVTPSATWGSMAYTQAGHLELMQLAAITGIWGITFVIAWFASSINWAWDAGFSADAVRTTAFIYGGVAVVVLLTGSTRIALADTTGPSVRVAAISYPKDEMFVPGEITRIQSAAMRPDESALLHDKVTRLQEWFLESTRREARAGAKLVAWPETNLMVFKEDEPAFLERARGLARDERIDLLMGMATVQVGAARPLENKAILVNAAGEIAFSHVKSRLVSGWEESVATAGEPVLGIADTRIGRISSAICYEMDFPHLIRQVSDAHADLLIAPSNDWVSIKWPHLDMATFRAVENGVPLLRPASSGLSAAIDPYGRVIARTDFFSPGARVMVAQLPLGRIRTVYGITGDLFAWLCLAALAIAALFAYRAQRFWRGFLEAKGHGKTK